MSNVQLQTHIRRMAHFGSARNLSVVVALDEQDPDLLVVTVITHTR